MCLLAFRFAYCRGGRKKNVVEVLARKGGHRHPPPRDFYAGCPPAEEKKCAELPRCRRPAGRCLVRFIYI